MGLRFLCCRWYEEVVVHRSSLCCVQDAEGGQEGGSEGEREGGERTGREGRKEKETGRRREEK